MTAAACNSHLSVNGNNGKGAEQLIGGDMMICQQGNVMVLWREGQQSGEGPNVVDVSIGVGAEITEGNVITTSSGKNLLAQLSGTAEAKMSCCKIVPAGEGRE